MRTRHLPLKLKPVPVYFTRTAIALLIACSFNNKAKAGPEGKAKFDLTAPLVFIENKGQVKDQNSKPRKDIQFCVSAGGGLDIFIGTGAIHYQFKEVVAAAENGTGRSGLAARDFPEKFDRSSVHTFRTHRMDVELIGANKHARVIKEQMQAYYQTYIQSINSKQGSVCRSFKRITYKDVYPNIDWVLFMKDGHLTHEFIVRAGGKISDIKIKYGGTTALALNADGSLTATTPMGTVTEAPPVSYEQNGRKVDSRFCLNGNIVAYQTGDYSGILVIDPTLEWASYFGASDVDQAWGLTTDGAGNAYIMGRALSTSGIATSGAYQETLSGNYDAILVKFNSAGVRQWATYYGGSGLDWGYNAAADGLGNIYMIGYTASASGIATSGAHQDTLGGSYDAFLVKFNSSGARQWATYYGGSSDDYGRGVGTDGAGNVYITGKTFSTSRIATAGAHQTVYNALYVSYSNGFLVKFNSSGVRQWGTYYGGGGDAEGLGLAMDDTGNVYITGSSLDAYGIATSGAYQEAFGGYRDAFLMKFNSSGVRQWGTYYGGSDLETGYGIATDGSANVYITGETGSSSGIATSGAYQTVLGVNHDAYLVKFNSAGARQWGTYYGGNDYEEGDDLATDASGNVYLSGFTGSTSGIASAGGYQTTKGGNYDAFLVQFNSSGARQWATYYGGSDFDYGFGVATDGAGNTYMGGTTASTSGVATSGAFQTTHGGGYHDAYLAKFNTGLPPITGTATVCVGGNTTLSDAVAGGTWSSTTPGIAAIGSATGVVTGVSAGTATISYTLGANYATMVVTVNSSPDAGTITGTLIVCAGDSTALSDAAGGGIWSSTNSAVAGVGSSTGVVGGVATGTATISYTVTNGCGTTAATAEITVNPLPDAGTITGTLTVCAGDSTALSDAAGGGVWSSTNTAVAGVESSTGVVGGVATGTATISYTVTNGCGTTAATAVVTVNPLPDAGTITGTLTVCVGDSTALSDAASGGIWSSTNTAVAGVGSSTGMVGGVAAGTATISYTVTDGCGTAAATAEVTVNPLPDAGTITGTLTACVGDSTALSDASGGGIWSSTNTAVAGVESSTGMVGGVAAGTATISYAVTDGCGTAAATAVVTVNPLPDAGTITGTLTVCASQTTTLGDSAAGGAWSSASTAIASVGSTGIVTGVSAGTATISYTVTNGCGTDAATAVVTVNSLPNAGTITGTFTACVGGTTSLSDGSAGGVWSSVTPSVATIGTSGIVTGVSTGTSTISYTVTNGCGTAAATAVVTVSPGPNAGSIKGKLTLCTGTTTALKSTVNGGTWSSGNPGVATVNASGVVTGVSAGTAVISYTVTGSCGATTITAIVTVSLSPNAGTITGTATLCAGTTTTLSDAAAGGAWSSATTMVATVNSSGIVTGVTGGTAVISYAVTNSCGTATATKVVTVNPAPNAGSIKGKLSVCPSQTLTLTDAAPGGVWSSTNPGVATIGSTGVVSGVSNGTTVISYTVTNGCGTAAATVVVTVATTAQCARHAKVARDPLTNIKVYPNPTEGTFTIELPAHEEDATISITDVMGRTVRTFTISANTSDYLLELNDLKNESRGLYLIKITFGDDRNTIKLLLK